MVSYCLIQDRPVYFISFNLRPNLQYSLNFEHFLFTFHTPCNECAALTYEYGSGRVVKTVYPQTPICYPRRRLWRNVRPTSQCQAPSCKSCSCFFAAPTAADDDDFRDFSHDDIFLAVWQPCELLYTCYFYINIFVLWYNDDDSALHDL